jgi:hypothetical protein
MNTCWKHEHERGMLEVQTQIEFSLMQHLHEPAKGKVTGSLVSMGSVLLRAA